MKTDEIGISQDPKVISDALDKIELIALYTGMSRRDATSMRLLAEEMVSATKDVLTAYDGLIWMETSKDDFKLFLSVAKPTDKASRDKLIALSKTGEAAAPKGLFARLGAAIEKMLLLDDGEIDNTMFMDYALYAGDPYGADMMSTYHYMPYEHMRMAKTPVTASAPAHAAKKDELEGIEKSIIDSIVDDIYVTPKNGTVEIVAVKKLK